jgi:hypothetical protein
MRRARGAGRADVEIAAPFLEAAVPFPYKPDEFLSQLLCWIADLGEFFAAGDFQKPLRRAIQQSRQDEKPAALP